MDMATKLGVLARAARYDASCASSGGDRARPKGGVGATAPSGVCHSWTPDGRCVSLLKLLYTNLCIYDCAYCVHRRSADVPRVSFRVDEIVALTMDFYRRNYIEGLFLSSGVARNADFTMERLVAVARTLRERERYGGYLHLKIVPGASPELIARAGRYADRLSANLELTSQGELDRVAPGKRVDETEGVMGAIRGRHDEAAWERRQRRRAPRFAPAGQSTQLVVGATDAADSQILRVTSRLYERYALRRTYYSAYSPIPSAGAGLPGAPPPLLREHRLYQADWLLRCYGFQVDELFSQRRENLPLDHDPKLAWALRNRERFPIDVNRAAKEDLLRIPGIGVRNVQRILSIRRQHRVTMDDLRKLRAAVRRAAPFVITADQNPALRHLDDQRLLDGVTAPHQLLLFEGARSALGGEV